LRPKRLIDTRFLTISLRVRRERPPCVITIEARLPRWVMQLMYLSLVFLLGEENVYRVGHA